MCCCTAQKLANSSLQLSGGNHRTTGHAKLLCTTEETEDEAVHDKPSESCVNNHLVEFKAEIPVFDRTQLAYYIETGLPCNILVESTC